MAALFFDIQSLKTSWTKFDIVQVIDVVTNIGEIELYKSKSKKIDEPILRSVLGIESLENEIPEYWKEIQNYPNQKRIFALLAAIFTHFQVIHDFAESSTEEMKGLFHIKTGKQYTNIRSALVESGAALNSFRRKPSVPYDFTVLFEEGKVGKLLKQVLEERLRRIGWNGEKFYDICFQYSFHRVLSISEKQFLKWLEGDALVERKLQYQLRQFKDRYSKITAYKVNQWLDEWNDIHFNEAELRKKPEPYFLMFKIDARLLKRLSDVHRRSGDVGRDADPALQRTHNQSRSQEIYNYIHGGFPWSTISKGQQESDSYKDLKMPGILPTAIIANILGPDSERGQNVIDDKDRIIIENSSEDFPSLSLPDGVFDDTWSPKLKPIEIIDGQHRLWAFDEMEAINGNYELPVIAYYNLDRAWQAYLFYTINIKPVKINTSLGYDLYPLLRTQNWLESSKDGLLFYRENRAQEIVEVLWSYKESPWRGRIKMIGEGMGNISQAAFVKAITSSFLKKSAEPTRRGMGGLFSDKLEEGQKYQVLNWNRTQQAAFIILLWDVISEKLNEFLDEEKLKIEPEWAKLIRESEIEEDVVQNQHPAFTSKNSFLSRDQGVRGISMFANDFFYSLATSKDWNLNEIIWNDDLDDKDILAISIDDAILGFKKHKLYTVLLDFAEEIVKHDWRTTSADFSGNDQKKMYQMRYKGSSGYTEVWKDLIKLFSQSNISELKDHALQLAEFIK